MTPSPAESMSDAGNTSNEARNVGVDEAVITRPVRISVVIPARNSASFLRQAIESALSQQPPPYEVVVQDGGSIDGSIDILRSFGERVKWQSQPDDGQAQALNTAIAATSGDVIVWLNADDLIAPGAFGIASEAFRRDSMADFAFGDYDMIRADGSIMRRFRSAPYDPDRVFTHGCYIFSGSIYFHRRLLERVGRFDERLHACMDLDYLLRIGEAKAIHLGRTVAQFRMSGAGKSSLIRGTFLREGHMLRQRTAGNSGRRRVHGLIVDAWNLGHLLTEPVRHTRAWSSMRRGKQL